MKTIFKTKKWHVYWEKTGSTMNGNGWVRWALVFRKTCGNGDDGARSSNIISSN